jgi:hypothetical protein
MRAVSGYLSNAPIDPAFLVANVPDAALDTKSKNSGHQPQSNNVTVQQEIKKWIQMQEDLSGPLTVLLVVQETLLVE